LVAKVKQDKAVIGEQTREEILEAASYYFVENGFEGTSIQNVADRAKVNKSLIYHHFQSKEELWKTVKTYIIKKSTFMDSFIPDASGGLRPFLVQVIYQRFEIYDHNPDLLRIVAWQNLEREKQKELSESNNFSPENWRPAIRELQKEGHIREEWDPDLVIVLIISALDGVLKDEIVDFSKETSKKYTYVKMVVEALYKALKVKE
jgi:AcrR family transcriptional regulator